jgi:hypothetical protein
MIKLKNVTTQDLTIGYLQEIVKPGYSIDIAGTLLVKPVLEPKPVPEPKPEPAKDTETDTVPVPDVVLVECPDDAYLILTDDGVHRSFAKVLWEIVILAKSKKNQE